MEPNTMIKIRLVGELNTYLLIHGLKPGDIVRAWPFGDVRMKFEHDRIIFHVGPTNFEVVEEEPRKPWVTPTVRELKQEDLMVKAFREKIREQTALAMEYLESIPDESQMELLADAFQMLMTHPASTAKDKNDFMGLYVDLKMHFQHAFKLAKHENNQLHGQE